MAASRTTVIQSLSIALIVFVMLTFVLAVTTYLFFMQKEQEVAKVIEANRLADEANEKLDEASAEKERLQKIIGFAELSLEEVENETATTLQTKFGDYMKEEKPEDRSYDLLVKKLKESADEKDKTVLTLQDEKEQLRAEVEAVRKAGEEKAAALQKNLTDAQAKADREKKELERAVARQQEERQALTSKYDSALEESTDLKRLQEKVAEAAAVLSSGRRVAGEKPEDQITAMVNAIRERDREIFLANETLATLRAKDPAVQKAVRDAIPEDDRIDGFDGRVVSVNEADRTVLILADSTRGMRPGLILSVYGPDDPTPPFGADKGMVEVVAIEGPTLARARIRRDATANPILGGDGVATNLWTPGESFEAVIVGYVQLDGDSGTDLDRLRELIESVGGSVAPLASAQTTMVIDGGTPRSIAGKAVENWRKLDEQRRDDQLKEARRLGLKVVGLDPFLRMMGLERDSLDANRLPAVAGAAEPPPRSR